MKTAERDYFKCTVRNAQKSITLEFKVSKGGKKIHVICQEHEEKEVINFGKYNISVLITKIEILFEPVASKISSLLLMFLVALTKMRVNP